MAAASKYDVVYYWSGGTEGKWRESFPGVFPDYKTVDKLVADLERAGYPTVRGLLSVGAPEGAPETVS